MKNVLVHVTPRPGGLEHGDRYAVELAAHRDAHLTALVSDVEAHAPLVGSDNMQGVPVRPSAPSDSDGIAETAALLRAAAHEKGLSSEVFTAAGALPPAAARLANLARVRDIVVLSVWGPVQYPRLSLVDAVLFGTGRPIILVPPMVARLSYERALIAWDATPSSVRALQAAMPLLNVAQDVYVLTIADDKAMDPEVSGGQLCIALTRRGLPARAETINRGSSDVGATLLNAAVQASANLLVMGGFAHPREREFLFGSATRSLFQSGFPMPVLMSH